MQRVATMLVVMVGALGILAAGCSSDGGGTSVPASTGDSAVTTNSSDSGSGEPVSLAGRSVRGFSPAVDAARRVGVVVTFGAESTAEIWVQLAEGDTASNEWTVSGKFTAVRVDNITTVSMADPCLTTILPTEQECAPLPPFTVALRGNAKITAVALSSAHVDALPPPFEELAGWLDVEEDQVQD